MHLVARLDDVATGPQNSLLVLGAEADLSLQHNRDLVLWSMNVRSQELTNRERMLHDRQGTTGVLAVDLEYDAPLAGLPVRQTSTGTG